MAIGDNFFIINDFNVKEMSIDAMSISAHKFYGPKGIGALYVRKGVRIDKFMNGGEQEKNKRAGTVNVPAAVGFGTAIEIAVSEIEENNKHLRSIRRYFLKKISEAIHNISLNGHPTQRLANNASISFEGVEGEAILMMLDREGIYVSTGSACSSHKPEPSHVLTAMGCSAEETGGAVRFSFDSSLTVQDMEKTAEILSKEVTVLRKYIRR